ncbi:MAG TPA: anti-sigma factor antagonist [Caldithrix abyssi]|uniref:Anti-sigma factor antagonist n=1 Tax=Caldithrix abyssi TaxID=187145 RepID=A0A7V1LPK3_CALAY|nr:anti-sigma factor antagonist [Caldithrix abyssi]
MSGFEVRRHDNGEVSILHLKGFLDAHTAPQFEKALHELVKENRVRIIVSMTDLDYISSAGLGVFMGFIEEIREKGGDIKLSSMSEKVYKVFDLLGFPSLYEIFDDESGALARFNETY